jgi:uncharacterized membrane protein HdeD (DUF308 family)
MDANHRPWKGSARSTRGNVTDCLAPSHQHHVGAAPDSSASVWIAIRALRQSTGDLSVNADCGIGDTLIHIMVQRGRKSIGTILERYRGRHHLQTTVTRSTPCYRLLFLSEGVVLILLGVLAVVIPLIAGSAAISALGWIFLTSGLIGLATMFCARHLTGIFWSLVSAFLGIIVGVALIAQTDLYSALVGWPLTTTSGLKITLVLFFLIEGVASIVFASEQRSSVRWIWMLSSLDFHGTELT